MKTKERIKNILIAVLLCGAVYLTYATWYFDSPENVSVWQILMNKGASHMKTGVGKDFNENATDAVRPLSAAIKTDLGRLGAPYGAESVNLIYDKTSQLVSEALGSASVHTTVSDEEWESALKKNGVFYDYRGEIRIDALSHWLNTGRGIRLSESARYVFLCIDKESDKVFLYLKSPYNNQILRFDTALNINDALAPLSGIHGNDSRFASELDGDYSLISPETLITPNPPHPPMIMGYSPIMQFTENKLLDILKAIGINSYVASRLSEPDGTRVFIEDMLTLRISPNGLLTFSDSRSSDEVQLGVTVQSAYSVPSDTEYIETALMLCRKIFSVMPGTGSIYMIDFRYLEEQKEYVVLLGISIDGIPLDMPDTAFFARVVFRGSKVTSAVFNMRYYETVAENATILPERLAIAAMLGSGQKGDLNLRYSDKGSYPLSPSWHIRLDEDEPE